MPVITNNSVNLNFDTRYHRNARSDLHEVFCYLFVFWSSFRLYQNWKLDADPSPLNTYDYLCWAQHFQKIPGSWHSSLSRTIIKKWSSTSDPLISLILFRPWSCPSKTIILLSSKYSETLIYCAPINGKPRFTAGTTFPPNFSSKYFFHNFWKFFLNFLIFSLK